MATVYTCAAIGVVVGAALGIAVLVVRPERSEQIAALWERIDFQFLRDVARAQVSRYHGLRADYVY